jgi:hypothetical protein
VLASLLREIVTYKTPLGRSVTGEHTYNASATTLAYIEYGSSYSFSGRGTTVDARDVMVTLVSIPGGSRVWLPGTNTANIGESREVRQARSGRSPDGTMVIYIAEFS